MKKFFSLILAAVMSFSCTVLLFSCKDKKTDENNSLSATDKQLEEGTIFYDRAQISDDLPARNFGGRAFRVVAHMPNEIFIPVEERGQGDLIKDAKASRNEVVEARFNTKIEVVYSGSYSEVSDYVSKTVLAGSDEFDLLMGMSVDTGNLVTKGVFLNWHDIPYINFDKPWWASSNKSELTVNGKCPLAISDLNYSAITQTWCMMFNKNLAASYDMGNIYQIVLDGKWTFDKLHELVKDVYRDDGNSEKDEGDFYGFIQNNGSSVNTYLWAFDNPVCSKNEEGTPQIAIRTDKINTIVSKLYDFLYNTNGVYFDGNKENTQGIAGEVFFSKRAIFTISSLGAPTGEELRNFEDDYGIIPYPKFDENQTEYKTMADGYHSVLAVPKTCRDTEFVGIITEALSAESWKLLTPTLYELALKNRYLRDDESKEIMDIIINGRTFDFGYIYDGWKGFSFSLQAMMKEGNSSFESYYNSHISSAKTHYKSIIKAFEKM